MQAKDLMSKKLVYVVPTARVIEAAKRMSDGDVGCVLVLEGGKLVGILTDRTITTGVVAEGKDPMEVQVKAVMTKNPITGTPEMDLTEASKLLGKYKIRRLPIVDREGRAVGVLSVADLARYLKEGTGNLFESVARAAK